MEELIAVKLKKTLKLAADGINVQTVVEGQTINLPPALSKALVRDNLAIYKNALQEDSKQKEEDKKDIAVKK